MWAENNPDGIGATFSFTLPLVIQERQDHEDSIIIDTVSNMNKGIEEGRKKRSIYYDSDKTRMKRIFLVDDDYDHTYYFQDGIRACKI